MRGKQAGTCTSAQGEPGDEHPSLRMQDRKSAREPASWCSLGPGRNEQGALLEDLMGGDGIDGFGDLDHQKAGKGGGRSWHWPNSVSTVRRTCISSELPSSASAALLWVWCLGGILEHWNGLFF